MTLLPDSLEYDSDDNWSNEHLASSSEFMSFVESDTGALCLGWDSIGDQSDSDSVSGDESEASKGYKSSEEMARSNDEAKE